MIVITTTEYESHCERMALWFRCLYLVFRLSEDARARYWLWHHVYVARRWLCLHHVRLKHSFVVVYCMALHYHWFSGEIDDSMIQIMIIPFLSISFHSFRFNHNYKFTLLRLIIDVIWFDCSSSSSSSYRGTVVPVAQSYYHESKLGTPRSGRVFAAKGSSVQHHHHHHYHNVHSVQESFKRFLESDKGFLAFKNHLQKEYSVENLVIILQTPHLSFITTTV